MNSGQGENNRDYSSYKQDVIIFCNDEMGESEG